MKNDSELGTRGASITPSARPSIHNHQNCPFEAGINMGKYGLRDTQRNIEPRTIKTSRNDQGIDEVDNVMSKLAHSRPKHRNAGNIRYSLTPDQGNHRDDDDVLAKSLPTNLPSHSNYSEEFMNWDTSGNLCRESKDSTKNNSLNVSHNSLNANEWTFESSHSSKSNDRSFEPLFHATNSPNLSKNYEQSSKSQDKTKVQQICMSVLGVASIIVACYYGNFLNAFNGRTTTNDNYYDQPKFYNDLNDLGKHYRISDDSILQVQSGISTIVQNEDAGSFIFLYNSNGQNFNKIELNNFMNDIANIAAKYLRNDSAKVQHVVVDIATLDMRTHSELMQMYRDDVTKTGVMLVKELDRLPSSLAMAFHYYCDEYNPLVKKSAIFFTLDMAICSTSSDKLQSRHARIEKCLSKKWNTIPEDEIGPLLTRVVSTVIDISHP